MRKGEGERTDELDRRAIAHVGALQLLHESRLVLQLLRDSQTAARAYRRAYRSGAIGTAQPQLRACVTNLLQARRSEH